MTKAKTSSTPWDDARLIAAAPELLIELEAAYELVRDRSDILDEDEVERIEKLISKAKGK